MEKVSCLFQLKNKTTKKERKKERTKKTKKKTDVLSRTLARPLPAEPRLIQMPVSPLVELAVAGVELRIFSSAALQPSTLAASQV